MKTPRNEASFGLFMIGNGKGGFHVSNPVESGIHIEGEIKAIEQIKQASGVGFLIARNNDRLLLLEKNVTINEK